MATITTKGLEKYVGGKIILKRGKGKYKLIVEGELVKRKEEFVINEPIYINGHTKNLMIRNGDCVSIPFRQHDLKQRITYTYLG
jgi:hypothetical protein